MLVVSLYLSFLAPYSMSERLLDTITKYTGDQNQQEKSDPVIELLGAESTDASRTSSRISRQTITQSKVSTAKLATLLNEIIQEAGLIPRRLVDDGDIS